MKTIDLELNSIYEYYNLNNLNSDDNFYEKIIKYIESDTFIKNDNKEEFLFLLLKLYIDSNIHENIKKNIYIFIKKIILNFNVDLSKKNIYNTTIKDYCMINHLSEIFLILNIKYSLEKMSKSSKL